MAPKFSNLSGAEHQTLHHQESATEKRVDRKSSVHQLHKTSQTCHKVKLLGDGLKIISKKLESIQSSIAHIQKQGLWNRRHSQTEYRYNLFWIGVNRPGNLPSPNSIKETSLCSGIQLANLYFKTRNNRFTRIPQRRYFIFFPCCQMLWRHSQCQTKFTRQSQLFFASLE